MRIRFSGGICSYLRLHKLTVLIVKSLLYKFLIWVTKVYTVSCRIMMVLSANCNSVR